MLAGIAEAVRCAVHRQVWIANKFQNRGCERLTVTRLNEQSILPMLNDFINIGRVPPISGHNDLVGESGAVDCVSYIDAAFQNAGALTNDDEARVGPLF